jgi:8-oxo-dGTP pyrophosphatase MutT (NUDIX family)
MIQEDIRTSRVAYVVARLLIDEEPHLLVMKHKKWGDWSLVGGKLEAEDRGDWSRAAQREAREELGFVEYRALLLPIFIEPISWGPVPSKSQGGKLTLYTAQYFAARFESDPLTQLMQWALNSPDALLGDFTLRLISPGVFHALGKGSKLSPIGQLTRKLEMKSIPLAWGQSLPKTLIPSGYFLPLNDVQ